jgi:hypothetical protein
LPIFIPPIAPQSPSSIIWGWYNRPVVAAVPSGLSLTALRIIIIKKIILQFLQGCIITSLDMVNAVVLSERKKSGNVAT